jgi:hypothetical protein
MHSLNDIVTSRFPGLGTGAVTEGNESAPHANETVDPTGAVAPAPQQPAELGQANTGSDELDTDAVEQAADVGQAHPGATALTNGSDEVQGAVKVQGTRNKGAGAVKAKRARKPRSTKSLVANTGAGKSHAVTTKLDAELLRKLTMARARSGMSESGLLRLALASYLDNLEQHSIAAEISRAAAVITAASQSSMAPVLERVNTLDHRFQEQLGAVVQAIKGIGNLLGEPVELHGLDGSTDAGESKEERS